MRFTSGLIALIAALVSPAQADEFRVGERLKLSDQSVVVRNGPIKNDAGRIFQRGELCAQRFDDDSEVLAVGGGIVALRYHPQYKTFGSACPQGTLFSLTEAEVRDRQRHRAAQGAKDEKQFGDELAKMWKER